MNHLACRSVDMALRMVNMYQCAYNLIRAHMQQSARAAGENLYRMSFTAAARLLSSAQKSHGSPGWSASRLRELLSTLIAENPVPLRPGRNETRAIKRRPSPFPLLTAHRHEMKTIPHQKKHRRPDTTPAVLS